MNNYVLGYILAGFVFALSSVLYFLWSKTLSTLLESDLEKLKQQRALPRKNILQHLFKKGAPAKKSSDSPP